MATGKEIKLHSSFLSYSTHIIEDSNDKSTYKVVALAQAKIEKSTAI